MILIITTTIIIVIIILVVGPRSTPGPRLPAPGRRYAGGGPEGAPWPMGPDLRALAPGPRPLE